MKYLKLIVGLWSFSFVVYMILYFANVLETPWVWVVYIPNIVVGLLIIIRALYLLWEKIDND